MSDLTGVSSLLNQPLDLTTLSVSDAVVLVSSHHEEERYSFEDEYYAHPEPPIGKQAVQRRAFPNEG